MLRIPLALFTVAASFSLFAQEKAPLAELAGPQWSVIGSGTAVGECKAGDAMYSFKSEPAQVVVKECEGRVFKTRTEAVTTWSAGGKSGIAFGGARYEVKSLPASAPACKGNSPCMRLAMVPDGKTDATRTLYLAR